LPLDPATLRPVPEAWKAVILETAAKQSLKALNNQQKAGQPLRVISVFSWLLWPHPRAWAALACLWVAIVVLNMSGPNRDALIANNGPFPQRTAESLLSELNFLISRSRMLALEENLMPHKSKL
jgi:hypothetical protein